VRFSRFGGHRSGVSEIISAIILLAITIAGFGLYFGVVQRNISLGASVPLLQYQHLQSMAGEDVALSYSSISSGAVYLVSYGPASVYLSNVILNPGAGSGWSRQVLAVSQLTLSNPSSGAVICSPGGTPCSPSNARLIRGQVTEVSFAPIAGVSSPGTLVLTTSDLNQFQFQV